MRHKRRAVRLGLFLIFSALVIGRAAAQIGPLSGTGTIAGNVTDETGLRVPGATIQVVQVRLQTNQLSQAVNLTLLADLAGHYSIALLPVGTYTVAALAPGYDSMTKTGVGVAAGQSAQSNFKLRKKPQQFPGFDSPYIGHDGSRQLPLSLEQPGQTYSALDLEQSLGEHWSFTGVIWPLFEPSGPTDASNDPTGAWATTDQWVIAAHQRGLNLLVQPVMSGNGLTPPPWVGLRTPIGYNQAQTWTNPDGTQGSSAEGYNPGPPRAPLNMQAAVNFFVKLVHRYKPGGDLAQARGWTDGYGVRAWEIENEPDSYDFWYAEFDDYAELLERCYIAMKQEDPGAFIVGPAASSTGHQSFLRALLDSRMQAASLEYKLNGVSYVGGPFVDGVSFHDYESLNGTPIEQIYHLHQAWWDLYATQPGFTYDSNRQYWHTEGNLSFAVPSTDANEAARWLPQLLARGFGAGISKITLMDLNNDANEATAAKVFLQLLPSPLPMLQLSAAGDAAQVYRSGTTVWTYVVWASSSPVTAPVPVRTPSARIIDKYGNQQIVAANGGSVAVSLTTAQDFNEPLYVVELPQ